MNRSLLCQTDGPAGGRRCQHLREPQRRHLRLTALFTAAEEDHRPARSGHSASAVGSPDAQNRIPPPLSPSLCGSHHQNTQQQTQFTAAAEAGVPTGCLVTATLAPSCSHSLRPTSTSGSSSMVPGGVLFPWGLGAQPGQWTPADRGQPGNGSMTWGQRFWGPRQPGVPC